MRKLFALIFVCLPIFAFVSGARANGITAGAGKYVLHDQTTARMVDVYYYKPSGYTPETPVVMVLHGLQRDAEDYRDSWIEYAEREQLMILTPHFTNDDFPGANGYNLGNLFRETGGAMQMNPQSQWAFTLIERVFTDFKAHRSSNNNPTYFLYGHGAGAQFAHRFAMFMPDARVSEIIVGAAGWYTFADQGFQWPYGIANVPAIGPSQIRSFLAQPILLVIGEADTATIQTVLRQTPEAKAQGKTRVDRTQNYFEYNRQLAKNMGVAFNWAHWTLPGVTHSPDQMTSFAAEYIAARAR